MTARLCYNMPQKRAIVTTEQNGEVMLEQRRQEPVYTNWLEGYNMSIIGEEKKKFLDMMN